MRRSDFPAISCSIARSAAVMDPWALLVIRNLMLGLHRFDQIQKDLGIASNVLAERLERLVEAGVLRKEPYARSPERFEYHFTQKGDEFVPVLLALLAWGDKWQSDATPPVLVTHHECGELSQGVVVCSECGAAMTRENVTYRPGPGGRVGPGTALAHVAFAGLVPTPAEQIGRDHGR